MLKKTVTSKKHRLHNMCPTSAVFMRGANNIFKT